MGILGHLRGILGHISDVFFTVGAWFSPAVFLLTWEY
jgi:hypothetical protein